MVSERIERFASIPEMHGAATVQLFNERGREILKQKQENFISPLYFGDVAKIMQLLYVPPNGWTYAGSSNGSFLMPATSMGVVMLTDYGNDPVPTSETIVQGGRLAFGVTGKTGGASYRGTHNQAESVRSPTYVKMVFDFATSEANGTFQSIYTLPGVDSGGVIIRDAWAFVRFARGPFSQSQSLYRFAGIDGGRAYFDENSGKITSVDIDDLMSGFVTSVSTVSTTVSGAHDGAVCNGKYYWLEYVSSPISVRLKSVPLSDLSAVATVERTFDSTWFTSKGITTQQSALSRLAYIPNKSSLIMGKWSGDGPAYFALDATTLADGVSWGSASSNGSFAGNAYGSDGDTLAIAVTNNGTSTTGWNNAGNPFLSNGDGSMTWKINAGSFAVATYQSSVKYITPVTRSCFTSRALLPSPVTKTSSQTMKITYEFNIANPFA